MGLRRVFPLAVLLVAGCGNTGANGTSGGFVGVGQPGSSSGMPGSNGLPGSSQYPGTGYSNPGSSNAPPAQPATAESVCGTLCNLGFKYQCVDTGTTTLSQCTTACVQGFSELTKDISLECWGAIIEIAKCADRAGALSCDNTCAQTTDGAAGAGSSNCQGSGDLKVDQQAAVSCASIVSQYPQCNLELGGSSSNNGSGGAGGSTNNGGSCQYPDCSGCANASTCDQCICGFQGDATQCTSVCG